MIIGEGCKEDAPNEMSTNKLASMGSVFMHFAKFNLPTKIGWLISNNSHRQLPEFN
jgi:hypothetical protein